jgi:DNA polymerase
MDDIIADIKNTDLPLSKDATNLVFGKGNPDTDIVFIGEAPGKQEDLRGEPFVGRAGDELDKLLNTINLSLDDVYIANVLKYRPPDNRDPSMDEIRAHTPFLTRQITAIAPAVIVTLGNFATKFCLAGFDPSGMNKVPGISNLHGRPKDVRVDDTSYKIMPMYHPAAMLYNPSLRETLCNDFQKLRGLLDGDAFGDDATLTRFS